jgi:hypothetical protein
MIPWWHGEIAQLLGGVQISQLPQRRPLNASEADAGFQPV